MNYNYIINPYTNEKIEIDTLLGKSILNNYINQLGGAHKTRDLTQIEILEKKLDSVKNNKNIYVIVVRRYVPFKEFGHPFIFKGDNRVKASTSENVTYKTGMYIFLEKNLNGFKINEVISLSTGTEPARYITKKIAHISCGKDTISFSKVENAYKIIENTEKSITMELQFWGSNPCMPLSPNINTNVYLKISKNPSNINIDCKIGGTIFPSIELYVKNKKKNILLGSYETDKGKSTGPFLHLWLNNYIDLINISKKIKNYK
uniref:Uncharacterized protein n=1 Tax=viral metagenome TaxID=1070528 RepID=A0A6C0IVH6_9ZZZZ